MGRQQVTGEAPRHDLAIASRESGVVWAGMLTLGVGFGVLVVDQGLPWWLAPVISGAMFAGSVEFLLIGLLVSGAPLGAIALTTFLINSRHLFYGLSFPLHRVCGRVGKAYSVFALCDEAYALLSTRDPAQLSSRRILWTQVGMHASWAMGSLLGAAVGASLLGGVEGLGFVLTALFLVLTMDAYRASPDRLTAELAVAAGVVGLLAAGQSMLPIAMAVFSVALLVRYRLTTTRGHTGHV